MRERVGLKAGGPATVITDKAVFRFDEETKEMYLSGIYPSVSVEGIKRKVSWGLKVAQNIKVVEPPNTEEIKFIRRYDPRTQYCAGGVYSRGLISRLGLR